MKHRFRSATVTLDLAMERTHAGWRLQTEDGRAWDLRAISFADRRVRLCVIEEDGAERWIEMPARRAGGSIELEWNGMVWRFAPAGLGATEPSAPSGVLTAPMVGVVAEVKANLGDVLARGQAVAIIEAMKIIAPVNAPFAGKVTAIHVQEGDRVEMGAVLAEVEPEGGIS
ncbi:MAG: biotin/lipoyl-binding protein [Armatimonadetes bacterium]|nr:biotin/lipoyl-binding protein [Armatimonadota bacterium]MDE2205746.1 biotin/lipoyl-binding protein [Armatimonadota bacterium]